ncbi:MAG: prenyltransferase [Candidatus Eremiobacteraeota bacterium]|nr:prenyltransferase [Candidatus Eremiobacteraeota bacterium]
MRARLAAFARLSRFKFLAGGFTGGVFGTMLAGFEGGRIDWPTYVVAQSTITALHLMTHYANEYYDRYADGRTPRTPYSGGSGVLRTGCLAPKVALYAALICAAAGAVGALALWFVVRQPIAALAAITIGVLAWSYSAPPVRFCARGLGEVATALIVGMLVPLCAFAAQRGWPDAFAALNTLPGAAAMFAMMLAVEYPDLAADTATGKRNLVVRLGAKGSKPLALAAIVTVYLAVAAVFAAGAPPAYGILESLSLPLSIGFVRTLLRHCEGDPSGDEALAGKGVALLFLVTFYGALAYGTVVPLHAGAAENTETNRHMVAVEGM